MSVARSVFFVSLLALFGLATYYLYLRQVREVFARPAWRRVGALVIAAPFFIAPLLRYFFGRGMFTRATATVALAWWGILLYTLMARVAIQVAQRVRPAPTDPARRLFLARAAAAGSLGVGGAVGSLGLYRAFAEPRVTEVPVRLAGLPPALEGFTLVQLSDLHIGPVIQERFIDRWVEVTNALHPDLVAITGDLVDGTPEQLVRFVSRFQSLRSRHGTFMVSGNHDYYSGWEPWVPHLEQLGFQLLRNRRVSVGDAGASFDLLGVEDWGGHVNGESEYDLALATQGRDPSRASVLLAHQPTNLGPVREAGLGLQLSGHTHGGQLFPANFIAEAIWKSSFTGLTRHGSLWQFTSRGCGFVGPPMRVDSPPEIVKVVLLRA